MIIGTDEFDVNKVKQCLSNHKALLDYVDALVPTWARHIEGIVDNQRYYIAVKVRNMLSVPYKMRMGAANELIKGITLRGMVDDFVTIHEIVSLCDKDKLAEALKWRVSEK